MTARQEQLKKDIEKLNKDHEGGTPAPKLEDLKEKDYPSLELEHYEGQKAKIDVVEVIRTPSMFVPLKDADGNIIKDSSGKTKFDPNGEQWCLRVQTEVIHSVPATGDDGNDLDIRGSELFNMLEEDKTRLVGGWGRRSKLAKFLSKLNVTHPSKLKGKKVTLRVIKKDKNGESKQFLGFIRE